MDTLTSWGPRWRKCLVNMSVPGEHGLAIKATPELLNTTLELAPKSTKLNSNQSQPVLPPVPLYGRDRKTQTGITEETPGLYTQTMLTTETSAAAQAEHQRPGVLFGRKIENERKPSQDFHRALALPPAWQLTATGSGHVLPSKNGSANGILRADGFASSPSPHTTPSPSSPQKHEASHSSTPTATTWPKETLLSEAYPPGARTPLRRSPTPEHAPPQLPDPVALAVQFNLQQHGNRYAGRSAATGSPYDDMVVPELYAFQSRAAPLSRNLH
eukprot:gene25346-26138_t